MSKYNRTYHFQFSPGLQNDDRLQKDISNLIGYPIVITEKLDGENTAITQGGVYARSHATYAVKPWNVAMRQLHGFIGRQLDEEVFLFGENMEGIHSIEYKGLESYFYLFGVKEKNTFVSWQEVEDYAYLLDLELVPVLFKGTINTEEELEKKIMELVSQPSKLNGIQEGIVCRTQSSFDESDFQNNVVKYVRKDHVQTTTHWTKTWKRAKISYK